MGRSAELSPASNKAAASQQRIMRNSTRLLCLYPISYIGTNPVAVTGQAKKSSALLNSRRLHESARESSGAGLEGCLLLSLLEVADEKISGKLGQGHKGLC